MGTEMTSERCRMFNGYVRNPQQIVVMVLVVGLFVLSAAIVATFFLSRNMEMPGFAQNEVIIENMQKEEETIRLITTKGSFSTNSTLISDYALLEKAVHNKETFLIFSHPFGGLNGKNNEKLWGITGANGVVYLNPEAVKAHQVNNLSAIMYTAWGLVIVYAIFTLLGWYFLSNAPRYPRLASLLVRKDWRNF